MTQYNQPLIFLMGPTASGKTALATYLYQHYPVEIISVDSALIYRGMDIGTAKPTVEELRVTPHYLIDIQDPEEIYSAAQFRRDALWHIEQIVARGNIPLLVGGTMLYFKALLDGLSPLPEADWNIRKQIEAQAAAQGWESLHQELSKIDPIAAARIHQNDPQRLVRALEVFRVSGKSMTELTQTAGEVLPYQVLQLAVNPLERAELHQRIERRFLQMLEMGFEAEVQRLMQRPNLHLDLPAMRSVGYRQMWQYLAGDLTREDMIFKAICATRQLAKRQLTWLRGWPDLQWCAASDYQAVDDKLQQLLSKIA